MLQEDEKRRRSEQIRAMRSLPVYMKSTFSSQIQATVARDAGTANAQRRPMGVDPVRCGELRMFHLRGCHSQCAALSAPSQVQHGAGACRVLTHCGTLVQPSFLGGHPVWCHQAAPVWRGTVQAQCKLSAGCWHGQCSCQVLPVCGMLSVRCWAQPVSVTLERTGCCSLRSIQPFESHCSWS